MFLGQPFPKTERVQRGISTASMWAACFHPLFILMVVCMLMTATTELVPGQWIPDILTNAGVSGILVLAFINGVMAVGRQCAGPFVHRISPIGMLIMSTVLSALGLFAMSHASGGMLFGAAFTFFANSSTSVASLPREPPGPRGPANSLKDVYKRQPPVGPGSTPPQAAQG